MCILFLSVIYSHYYAWWCYFNAFNDDYYNQAKKLYFSFVNIYINWEIDSGVAPIAVFFH